MIFNPQVKPHVDARLTPHGSRLADHSQTNCGRVIRGIAGKIVGAMLCWGLVLLAVAPLGAEPPSAGQQRQLADPWQMPAGTAIWGLPPQSPHRLIQSPPLLSPQEKKARAHRGKLTPAVATIDRAAVQNVWRQPYAYGYFGAQPNRHWQRHFGWNQAYTQWTLK